MKKRIFCIVIICIALFSAVCFATENSDVMSISEEQSDYVIPEEYRRDDGMLISEETNISSSYTDGDKFIIEDESTIISNENINGNVFAIVTPNLTIENTTINGNLFVFSNNLQFNNVHISGSVFILAQEVTTTQIDFNDLYFLGTSISLDGNIARGVKISAKKVNINSQINGNVFVSGADVVLGKNAMLNKNADINYTNTFENLQTIGENINANKVNDEVESISRNEQIKMKLINWIKEIVKTIIIVGFIILFTNRKFEKFNSKFEAKNYIGLTLKGFLYLIVIPIAVIMIIILSAGYLIGLPIVILTIYFIIAYLSLQIVSISIASNIKNKKMADKGNVEYIGITIIIMTILWLLSQLPVAGIMIGFIVISLALGIMAKYIFNNKEKGEENKVESNVEIKE